MCASTFAAQVRSCVQYAEDVDGRFFRHANPNAETYALCVAYAGSLLSVSAPASADHARASRLRVHACAAGRACAAAESACAGGAQHDARQRGQSHGSYHALSGRRHVSICCHPPCPHTALRGAHRTARRVAAAQTILSLSAVCTVADQEGRPRAQIPERILLRRLARPQGPSEIWHVPG
eukprot:2450610-Prymnesium_polylepis.1